MNILVPDSWLREYLKTEATPKQLKDCLSLCGPSIERMNTAGNETVYDIEITSNRVDMASIHGIAREAAAILPRFGIKAQLISMNVGAIHDLPAQAGSPLQYDKNYLPLTIQDPHHLCHRIIAVVIDNVTVQQAPQQMRERIEASGIRSLNNLIDITNYVMLELGHPCHVFDYDRLNPIQDRYSYTDPGSVTPNMILRYAKKDETAITLDDKRYSLSEHDIVIDNGTGQVIDLPGIMGTANSVVTDDTKRIVVFIESNDPVAIRRTSMRYGIRSYAATINEKHPDPELAKTVLLRAIDLYTKVAGGTVASDLIDVYPNPTTPTPIFVSVPFINERLGVTLAEKEIIAILESLSFRVETQGIASLRITPPTFRQFDVTIPEDIVEEVARLYGYYRLPGNLMTGEIPVTDTKTDAHKTIKLETTIKHLLRDWGYTETYTYSFVSKELIDKAGLSKIPHIKVANPLTEEITHMRASLLPSLLAVVEKNQYYSEKLTLFELSSVYGFKEDNSPEEKRFLQIVTTDSYAHLKGTVEQLLDTIGVTGTFARSEKTKLLHPNKQACIAYKKDILGNIGCVDPRVLQSFNILKECMTAQLDIEKLSLLATGQKKYLPISPYPAVQEDFSLQLPERTEVGEVMKRIYEIDPLISSIRLIDKYNNTITLRITYQSSEKTLTGDDTQQLREQILTTLKKDFQIELKK